MLLALLPWPISIRISAIALVAGHAAWLTWRFRNGPNRLALHDDGYAILETTDKKRSMQVIAARHLPGAVQLILKPTHGRSCALLLIQDAISPEDFHELCARIHQHRLPVRESAASR